MTNLSKLIEPLKLDYVNFNITDELFLDSGVRGKTPKLFSFDTYISSEDIIQKMNAEGYRPATAHELLVWGNKSWDGKDWIIALGSVVEVSGRRPVLYLHHSDFGRNLDLSYFARGWFGPHRFLAFPQVLPLESEKLGAAKDLLDGLVFETKGSKYQIKKLN